jgi:hypothetical protein
MLEYLFVKRAFSRMYLGCLEIIDNPAAFTTRNGISRSRNSFSGDTELCCRHQLVFASVKSVLRVI